jgi:hypothetical protein
VYRQRNPFPFFTLMVILFLGVPARAVVPNPLPEPAFDNPESTFTNAGSIRLSWSAGGVADGNPALQFELQGAAEPDFTDARTRYAGPDMATYISGLPDGRFHYRVRLVDESDRASTWSAPVLVVVEHHSMGLAWLLFGLGAFVFVLTVLVVARGDREDRSGEPAPAEGA